MDDGEEKKDPVKYTPTKNKSTAPVAPSGDPTTLGAPSEFANPLYCTSIDGKYVYKDPSTGNEFLWDETVKQWKPSAVGGGTEAGGGPAVQFDGSSYTYTDASDGTKYEWDPERSAWFPKTSQEADTRTASAGASASGGFTNPNYDSSSAPSAPPGAPRRFYYAALSPSEMGVNEPVLFLSPDDQVNNNSTIPASTAPDNRQSSSNTAARSSTANPGAHVSSTAAGTLPPGWERHEDANGPYYWHIKSGTIQRELPTSEPVPLPLAEAPALLIPGGGLGGAKGSGVRRSQTISSQLSTSLSFCTEAPAASPSLASNGAAPSTAGGTGGAVLRRADTTATADNREKRKSWSQYLESSERESRLRESLASSGRPRSESSLRFIAVSLGCLSISEEDLTPERSSRAVSKVIAELTSVAGAAKVGNMEVAGHGVWGEGSELFLELDDAHLRVKTKPSGAGGGVGGSLGIGGVGLTVAEQPIHSIRVWGVGRDDPRDFAYVAREKLTRQFLCHVFRLEMNARPLASALRDACKKIMIERQQKQKRPTTLPTGLRKGGMGPPTAPAASGTGAVAPACFPTPMDEPRKILKAYYLGSKMVSRPTGMDVLNGAIDALRNNEPLPVAVSVAPSVLLVSSEENRLEPRVSVEIRVRYLSFMGIGRDVQTCGVIVHTARDDFQAHCFLSTPSSGALCKAIEAACVLRYQKCLDAHHVHDSSGAGGAASGGGAEEGSSGGGSGVTSTTPGAKAAANIAAAFKNAKSVLSSLGRSKSQEDKVDDEFLARYQLNYGFNESGDPATPPQATQEPPEAADTSSASTGVKRKAPPAPPTWFELDDAQNTKVYVSNLPLDITEAEFIDLVQKYGLLQKDPATQAMKIKLYTDEQGNVKGDGLATYFKIESVQLALQILDGYELRGKKLKVERAKFQLKGAYDPSKKPKQKKRKEKEKLKKMEEQLFAWRPEKLRGERPKHERVVVVQNAFSSADFDKDASLILEYQEDFREEAGKCGSCKKVVVFDRHPEGVLQIFMSTPEEADGVVQLFNGRFFGGKQIVAFLWDGHTKYKIAETDAEREQRLENWEKFIATEEGEDGGVGEVPEEEKVTPPRLPEEEDEDDD